MKRSAFLSQSGRVTEERGRRVTRQLENNRSQYDISATAGWGASLLFVEWWEGFLLGTASSHFKRGGAGSVADDAD
jgi:hypothetical protein